MSFTNPEMRGALVPVFLAAQILLVHAMASREHPPAAPALSAFPVEFGQWKLLRNDPLAADVATEIRADLLVSQTYSQRPAGSFASLFVAWFQTQRGGAWQPHSPKVCLPASGWTPEVIDHITLDTLAGAITVNRYVVASRMQRAVVLYWYQTPRRALAGEWTAKFWLVADALRDKRTRHGIGSSDRMVGWGKRRGGNRGSRRLRVRHIRGCATTSRGKPAAVICENATMLEPMVTPAIPAEEFPGRWTRVQAMMQREKLDLLVAYADDRAVFGPAHARWLANFPVHFEPVGILLFPSGMPVMLCGPETREYALLAGRISDVRILREFTHPSEDYPHTSIQSLPEVVAEAIPDPSAVRIIGLAGRSLMSAEIVASLEAAFPRAQWGDVENAMCDMRAQKSPAELTVIRYAYRIAEAGLDAAVKAIRVGVTEREVAAEAEAAMRRLGAEGTGIDTIVASGPNSRPILARSTFRKIQADELVLLTVAPRYEGYHAAIGRPVLVGNPGDEIRRAVEVAWQAQEACYQAMRPGIEGRNVEAIGRRIVDDAGLSRYFLYSGIHSVGVIEFEPPIFGPSSRALFQPNMVISVDIPLFDAPWGGLRIEDGFLITDTGAERLHHTPYLIER